jgi:hypothetical protein
MDDDKVLKMKFAIVLAVVLLGVAQLAHLAWSSLAHAF